MHEKLHPIVNILLHHWQIIAGSADADNNFHACCFGNLLELRLFIDPCVLFFFFFK